MADTHIVDDALDSMARNMVEGREVPSNEHLRSCMACREKLTFLVEFYAAAAEELRKPPFAGLEELATVETSFPKPITLRAFHPAPDLAALGVVEPSILLAAQTISESSTAPVTIATFVSERDHAIARVTRVAPGGEYELTLVTPGEHSAARLLVSLAGTPVSLPPLLTDKTGSAEFVLREETDWDNVSVLASPPLARFILENPLTAGLKLTDGGISCQVSSVDIGHCLAVHGVAGAGKVVVVSSDARYGVVPLRDASAIVPRPWDSEAREILLFP